MYRGEYREDLHLRSVQGIVKDNLEAAQLGQDNELDVDALISRGYEDSVHSVSVLEPLFLVCKIRIIMALTSKGQGGISRNAWEIQTKAQTSKLKH